MTRALSSTQRKDLSVQNDRYCITKAATAATEMRCGDASNSISARDIFCTNREADVDSGLQLFKMPAQRNDAATKQF